MARTFQIFVKTSNDAEWQIYGTFTIQEWEKEQAHIRFLRSISPLYLKTTDSKTTKYHSFDNA